MNTNTTGQQPLFLEVDNDDKILLNSADALWYKILYYLNCEEYIPFAVEYYNDLYDFNKKAAQRREERKSKSTEHEAMNIESKEEAKERLLFERLEAQKKASDEKIIFNEEFEESEHSTVDAGQIAPGMVPIRLAGKKPKCFFSLFKSFLGTVLMGFPAEPENVHLLLQSNPAFMRICAFAPKFENDEYCYKHLPSLRKLEQFDQIMTEYGIWDKIKIKEVSQNLKEGIIKRENKLVGDTTHYHAYSGFETLKYIDDNGKEKKKSQSKLTKKCGCDEKKTVHTPGN